MNKILLIIKREYISRVKKKSFLIMTVLGPILFSGLFIVPIWLATRGGDEKVIQVIDESGLFAEEFVSADNMTYVYVAEDLETAKSALAVNNVFGLLYIPEMTIEAPEGVKFYSTQNPGFGLKADLEKKIRERIENIKLINSGLNQEFLDGLKSHVAIQTVNLSDSGSESESSTGAATAVGYIGAFLIYFFIFLYGAQIMRGVIEEKTNRIIEVIIASVKPFHLMMGKIIGVGGVGLTQFLLWVALSSAIVTGITAVVSSDMTPEQIEAMQQVDQLSGMPAPQQSEAQAAIENSMGALGQINIPLVLSCFVFYFIAGYLFYGALFAAIGSAVDSDADSQQFMFPVTIPLIFSVVVLSAVINDPHGSLAFWLSLVPFTSPVIMMMRIPFDVPVWQIALSMVSMVGGFIFTTWLASRIYRVGIFMHGTKVNYKTLAKWFMMKS
ncbi:ABC transporter permease [Reichenbachiella agariperforans]|uniref:ABC transporter permease n=1 Tax=Reichenbachiella agariperforans TaxID=156994 RepID=UPI001C095C98|nr:ABC transporter permease [Reichenbachiella agariperforans]MBU2915988.1 ABC transporter permease [Reichenbachiella agariperforans]